MTTKSSSPPNDSKDHMKHMQWLVETEKRPSVVPPIPPEYLRGSGGKDLHSLVLQRALANPLVPLGMVATVGCLVGMLNSVLKRESYRAQLYMRGRCLAQGFTVAALVGIKPDGVGVSTDIPFTSSTNEQKV
ncbi:hypoxia induced protein region [Dictyocaulus viviparus]|uniref:Hypoxia induced protein region n=1 Tax=Dictyocaulus viviparus TaxID=29172 RepID=A0A0D8XER3_DICVI|nr:hypoxia induced protein region [Dictyocaulus viviparus]